MSMEPWIGAPMTHLIEKKSANMAPINTIKLLAQTLAMVISRGTKGHDEQMLHCTALFFFDEGCSGQDNGKERDHVGK